MSSGYTGTVLFVNLTSGLIKEEQLPDILYRSFIGAVGLGVRVLYERMGPGANALGPDNILGFVAGLLTGSGAPMSSRVTVVTKSPLTGTWGDSTAGGPWGSELKAAGYDAVFFTGISPRPVYLSIEEGKAELRDASHLWGKDTIETEEMLRKELGGKVRRIACIGPSGESSSLLAAIILEEGTRAAARSGVGAVMGAKRLKAVAVKGTRNVAVADPEAIREVRRTWLNKLRQSGNTFFASMKDVGTSDMLETFVMAGANPIKNWTLAGPKSMSNYPNLAGKEVIKYQIKKTGCPGCPMACGGIVEVKDGSYAVSKSRKPEYETVAGFGTMCLNGNLESIIKANDICNRYGIDTISTGTAIAFAMECYERGLISRQETDGIELTWGNAPAIIALLDKIVRREGFGGVLADGVKRAAEQIGGDAEECAIHIHGQEPGLHDPRQRGGGRGLGYIVDPTPGRHVAGQALTLVERGAVLGTYPELQLSDRGFHSYGYLDQGAKFAAVTGYHQTLCASGVCSFAEFLNNFPLVQLICAVTGWDFTAAEAIVTGQRIQTLRHAFNVREGLYPREFNLPRRLAMQPSVGPLVNSSIDFEHLRAGYYKAMDWDIETGRPSEQILRELGLKELVEL